MAKNNKNKKSRSTASAELLADKTEVYIEDLQKARKSPVSPEENKLALEELKQKIEEKK